jgi:hypothetical protein
MDPQKAMDKLNGRKESEVMLLALFSFGSAAIFDDVL